MALQEQPQSGPHSFLSEFLDLLIGSTMNRFTKYTTTIQSNAKATPD
ncbi:MAG: hypothetical protein ABJH08_11785 [Balneola sp.]